MREAVLHMGSGGWGRICAITSVSVKQPIPDLALSTLARTGLWAWARTEDRDLYADGITLNRARPGLHATDRAVAFLCSQAAAFINATALVADGGSTLGLL